VVPFPFLHPFSPLIPDRIVGHSLGAGTGTLLSILMKHHYSDWNLRCYAFAPPPVVTKDLALGAMV
jgi:hypothetical protein